jgi:lipoprotein-anchoring transpeptidase ErfK/SrfK
MTHAPGAEPTPTAAPAEPSPSVAEPPPVSVEIDLTEQRAYLLKNGRQFTSSPISSGRFGHLTPTGDFKIIEKDLDHESSLYGKIVDRSGRTIIADADSDMSVPRGCRFVAAPMRYFMRFDGANGMHAGHLPGYPASHGCVRLPKEMAVLFFNSVEIGTPVHVFGKTPARKPSSRVVSRPETVRRPAARRPEPPRRRNFFERLFGPSR